MAIFNSYVSLPEGNTILKIRGIRGIGFAQKTPASRHHALRTISRQIEATLGWLGNLYAWIMFRKLGKSFVEWLPEAPTCGSSYFWNESLVNHSWLVVWNMFFPYIGNNHPNWRTHIFQRGRYTTNQVVTHNYFAVSWIQIGFCPIPRNKNAQACLNLLAALFQVGSAVPVTLW